MWTNHEVPILVALQASTKMPTGIRVHWKHSWAPQYNLVLRSPDVAPEESSRVYLKHDLAHLALVENSDAKCVVIDRTMD